MGDGDKYFENKKSKWYQNASVKVFLFDNLYEDKLKKYKVHKIKHKIQLINETLNDKLPKSCCSSHCKIQYSTKHFENSISMWTKDH